MYNSSFINGDSIRPDDFWFDPIWTPLDIIILVSLIGVYTFVFIKLRFKMDFSGMVTLVLHLLVALQRVLNHIFKLKGEDKVYYDIP